jgi:hypothetical protein
MATKYNNTLSGKQLCQVSSPFNHLTWLVARASFIVKDCQLPVVNRVKSAYEEPHFFVFTIQHIRFPSQHGTVTAAHLR